MNFIDSCLIGYSGTIGKHLQSKIKFKYKYNSRNIKKINYKKFKLVVCCGLPGAMNIANQNPGKDLENVNKLIKCISTIQADKFILISTIQVFSKLDNKKNNEFSKNLNNKLPYGKHRRIFEKYCEKKFQKILIIRLPSIFGKYIKKNFIFDILNPLPSFLDNKKYKIISKKLLPNLKESFKKIYTKKQNKYFINRIKVNRSYIKKELVLFFEKYNFVSTSFTNPNSKYQYYNLENLAKDIKKGLKLGINYLNISTEPIYAKEIYRHLTKKKMKKNKSKVYKANMISKYHKFWKKNNYYLYEKNIILKDLKKFYKNKINEFSNF